MHRLAASLDPPRVRGPHAFCLLEGGGTSRAGSEWNGVFREPAAVFTSRDGRGVLHRASGGREPLHGDPFVIVRDLLIERPEWTAVGYWSYELGRRIEPAAGLPVGPRDDLGLPDCWQAFFDRGPAPLERPIPVRPLPSRGSGGQVVSTFDGASYCAAVQRVLDYIAAGDCYQVNLSQRFSAPRTCETWELYRSLTRSGAAPYAAFLECGDHTVISASPELFLRIRDREVETRPIKGTRPRGAGPEEDAALAAELLASAKDRAELLMIVDLERNDLGKLCEYGSIRVPELYRLESYENVHHLVATVRGRLRPEVHALDCLRATFPGGSITGAPKIRAMQIIEELEPVRRGVYTGAIGWVSGRGEAEWSVAIRTMVEKDGHVYFHAGGGIVADSRPLDEYRETLVKARRMLHAVTSRG